MDVRFLPFVKSSRSVRRPDGEVPVGASSAPVNHLPRPHSPPSSSTCERREDVRLSRHLLPTGSLDREGSSRLPGWDMWEEDPASFRDLPNPSQLRKRARAGESAITGSKAASRRGRKQEDRPDVFDHLAQLRRKQHRFEEQSTLQAVPSSPRQQWSTEPSPSLHGLTPTKVYGDTRMTMPAPSAGATYHHHHHHRGEESNSLWNVEGLPELEASFHVPSLAVEGTEDDGDGLAEVVSFSAIWTHVYKYSNTIDGVPPHPLPEPWSPPVMSPADEPSEPCTFDPSTFSIKLYFPREE